MWIQGWQVGGKSSGQPWLNQRSPFCSPLLACVTLSEHVTLCAILCPLFPVFVIVVLSADENKIKQLFILLGSDCFCYNYFVSFVVRVVFLSLAVL